MRLPQTETNAKNYGPSVGSRTNRVAFTNQQGYFVMMADEATKDEIVELVALLEQRVAIIGDADLRESDPDAQLVQLKNVSESIFDLQKKLAGRIPFRLEHFLESCSYDKALGWAQGMLRKSD